MADGSNYQEAVANAEQVIEEWIDTAREEGRAGPKTEGTTDLRIANRNKWKQ